MHRNSIFTGSKNSVICRLETYIGNKLDWKHLFRLETRFLDWKPDIGPGKGPKVVNSVVTGDFSAFEVPLPYIGPQYN